MKERRYQMDLVLPRLRETLAERLERHSMPVPECGCWLWISAIDETENKGYGQLTFEYKHYAAHRASWLAFRGPIPRGMHVLHRCNTRICINPNHLYLGTDLENHRDRVAAGTAKNPPRKMGSQHGMAKINDGIALAIRRSKVPYKILAEEYGVKIATINAIKSGRQWRHV